MSMTTLAGIGVAIVAVGHAITGFATGNFSQLAPDLMAALAAFGLYKAADAK